jgi:hypothetical protein
MLGIAEPLCMEKGLDWAFCDTDSMAIASPTVWAKPSSSSVRNRFVRGLRR